MIYQTSRLSRDRVSAGLFHRELRKVGVEIHYAVGAGDPATAEGGLMIALQQAFDEYERRKLSRETKRGMRQSALQGFRNGGRAPYGYRLEPSPHPVAARAKAGETKTRLVPDEEQAEVVAEIFHLWADRGYGCKAIADHLNRPGGPPSPAHVDSEAQPARRLGQEHHPGDAQEPHLHRPAGLEPARLRHPARGRRHRPAAGGRGVGRLRGRAPAARLGRAVRPGTGALQTAPPQQRPRGPKTYLFTGMVRCASGHQPLAMYGRTRKEHTYMTCDYGRSYGKVAADQIEGHGQWLSIREDALLPLVESFFCERIFGPMRLEKLARQLRAHQKAAAKTANGTQKRLREEVADLDHRIGKQIEALEQGVEPQLVSRRIEKLRRAKEAAEIELRALYAGFGRSCGLRGPLRAARAAARPRRRPPKRTQGAEAPGVRGLLPPDHLRQAQSAHRDLRDHHGGHRGRPREQAIPPAGGLKRRSKGHSGGGIRTRDLRVMSPTSYLTAPPRGDLRM